MNSPKLTVFSVKNCIFLNILFLSAILGRLSGAEIVWEDTGTDWGTGANWVGDAVPTNDTTTDIAVFSDTTPSNQPNLGSAFSVSGLKFTTGGWTLSGSDLTLGAGDVTVNSNLSNTINLDVTDATNSNYLLFGGSTLTFNGAFNSTANHSWGTNSSHSGTIVLKGNQAMSGNKILNWGTMTFDGGTTTGTGSFLVGDSSTSTNGTMNVINNANVTGNLFTVGSEETGVLNINSGADLTMTTGDSEVGGFVGGDASSNGTINLDGSGSTLTVPILTIAGLFGTGTVNITNGGVLTATDELRMASNSGGVGYLNIDGTGSKAEATNNITIGREAGGSASATVSNNGLLKTSAIMYVGDKTDGTLTLNTGGDLEVNDLAIAQNTAGVTGTVSADGSGTTITATSRIYIGNAQGTGSLTLSNGATATVTLDTRIGSGATGNLTVSGSGSQYNGVIRVGYSSSGVATVSDNALLSTTFLDVGYGTGSGDGTLNLTTGADATSTGSLNIGVYAGSVGSVNASGSGTTITNNYTYVGGTGTGTLNLTDGATLDTGTGELRLANSAGSSGTLNVAGTGTQVDANVIRIGVGGSGVATISNNATVNGTALQVGNPISGVAGTVNIRSGATVAITGNTSLETAGSVIDLEGGTLNTTGTVTISAGGAINGYGTINQNITNNGSMTIDGTMTYGNVISGTGTLTKSNIGTLTLTGANTYTGATSITGGTLAIGASGVISDSSNVAISGGGVLGFSGSYNEEIGDLSVGTEGGSIDFNNGNSELLFQNDGTFSDILVIQNWDSANDKFGMVDSSHASLDKIKFVGYGGAATLAGSTSSIAGGTGYLITASSTFAQWDGGTDTNPDWNFNSGENWVGDVTPVSGDALNIEFAGTTNLSPQMTSSYTANTLKFASGAGAFTLADNGGGEVMTLAGILPSIVMDATNNQTISHALQLGDGTNPNGSLVVGGSGSGNLTISGAISDPSGTFGITKVGSFSLIMSGTNTFTGDISLQEGTISVGADANLGGTSAGLDMSGGTLATTGTFTLNSSRAFEINKASNLSISNGTSLTFGGALTGSADLTLNSAGTFVLTGNSTHTGQIIVSNGVLNLSTGTVDSKIKVSGGEFYGGTTANAIAAALEVTSGTLSAATDSTAGDMKITGSDTSYLSAGTFIWNVSGLADSGTDSDSNGINEVSGTAGTHFDLLSFTDALSFEGATTDSLVFKMRNISSSGLEWGGDYKEFKIIEASGGIVGFNENYFKFDSTEWTDGGGWWIDWKAVQKGNAIWLQYNAVPEPGTWVAIFGISSVLGLGIFRKLRKKRNQSCPNKF